MTNELMAEREAFEKWVTEVWRPDDGRKLLEKEFPHFAFAAWQARAKLDKVLPDVVRDAERYRWLRDEGDSTWNPLVKRKSSWTTKQIDAAIDAAMAAREGGK